MADTCTKCILYQVLCHVCLSDAWEYIVLTQTLILANYVKFVIMAIDLQRRIEIDLSNS